MGQVIGMFGVYDAGRDWLFCDGETWWLSTRAGDETPLLRWVGDRWCLHEWVPF